MPGTHSVAFSTSRDVLPAAGLGGVVSEMTPALIVCDSVPRKVLICRIECLPFASLEQTSAHIQIPLPFHLTLKKGMSVKRCRKVQRQQPTPYICPQCLEPILPIYVPKGSEGGRTGSVFPVSQPQGLAGKDWPCKHGPRGWNRKPGVSPTHPMDKGSLKPNGAESRGYTPAYPHKTNQSHHVLAGWQWANRLIFPWLSFSPIKWGKLPSSKVVMRIKNKTVCRKYSEPGTE